MRLYNSFSRKIEDFKPLDGKKVRMYHCGPTVYNYAHIGNLRAFVFADTIRRAMEYSGYKAKQVINITDVGHLTGDRDQGLDKIEEEAKKEGKTASEITDFYSKSFFDDIAKLNINITGTLFPKATEHITEQIKLIETLEKKGIVYKISDGIYFDTTKFQRYGMLGQADGDRPRIGVNAEKRHRADFALWKFSRPEEKRQQEWPSPWGIGFPGWHIECSAMAMKYLGETIDIHTGGIDHIPVHHNNEIAQSESATGKPLARFWLHNEFVIIGDEKMSKSEDNFVRLETLMKNGIHPIAYRYWLLTAHYRSPIFFSFEAVRGAQNALESIIRKISSGKNRGADRNAEAELRKKLSRFIENDLDTPGCIALLNETAHKVAVGAVGGKIIADFDAILGLDLKKLVQYTTDIPEKIKKLSRERETYRLSNNWRDADEIRREMENIGYSVDDSSAGPQIRRNLSSFGSDI